MKRSWKSARSGEQKPVRMQRRMKAKIFYLSLALENPHQALDACMFFARASSQQSPVNLYHHRSETNVGLVEKCRPSHTIHSSRRTLTKILSSPDCCLRRFQLPLQLFLCFALPEVNTGWPEKTSRTFAWRYATD